MAQIHTYLQAARRHAPPSLKILASSRPVSSKLFYLKAHTSAFFHQMAAKILPEGQLRAKLQGQEKWCREVFTELDWWWEWLDTKEGAEWAAEVQNPNRPLQEALIQDLIPGVAAQTVSILDVGAGPVTGLGYRCAGKFLDIVAVDPLARQYRRLLRHAGITAPVQTVSCKGEHLLRKFGPESFDFAYACNSLDHSSDPLLIIENMIALVRSGGSVLLRHYANEGRTANYKGLHQWNFDVKGQDLILWNRTVEKNLTQILHPNACVECCLEPSTSFGGFDHSDWVVSLIKKAPVATPIQEAVAEHGEESTAGSASKSEMVSVIITCYNQAAFLSEAIESALAQTHPGVDLLVVDDGSTDETAQIARGYSRVRLVRKANAGLAAARNTGLHHCHGAYVVFLDADDRLLPHAVESGLDYLRKHPGHAFAAGSFRRIGTLRSGGLHRLQPDLENDHYSALLRRNFITMHATVMYRRTAFEKVGEFDTSLRACEDYEMYLRIARQLPIVVYDRPLAEYREHSGNMSNDSALMLTSRRAVLRSQLPYVKGNADYEDSLKIGLRTGQEVFGRQLTKEIRARLEEGNWSRALRGSLALLRYAPAIFLEACRALPAYLFAGRPRATKAGGKHFGSLRRLFPFSRDFGVERGQPIDRYYIEDFLGRHAEAVRGRVLEVGDDQYTRKFGRGKVEHVDVLDIAESNPAATIVADLTRADHIPPEAFDCIIFTQTLQLIYDVKSALKTLHRILKPGGALLATMPGISQISDDEWADSWCWSFTATSAERLFAEIFPAECIEVQTYGNVLTSSAFLFGLAMQDLRREELKFRDPRYQLLVAVHAVRPT